MTTRHYFRKVIRIRAEDSPNVKLARMQIDRGMTPDHRVVVPGVLTYAEYLKRRATWDKVRQTVGLDAEFYEGSEVKMFPRDWLDRAIVLYRRAPKVRQARGIGVDPAEGGDDTAMAAVDEHGLIELVAAKTPDTASIPRAVLTFMGKHKVPPNRVCFDRGGGGKQHADWMRDQGHRVRTVAFGGRPDLEMRRWRHGFQDRLTNKEDQYSYLNRRGEMYDTLRQLLDPSNQGWSLPPEPSTDELCRQLLPIPLTYDQEGRLYVLPKNRHGKDRDDPDKKTPCLSDLIGCSPDETDAVLLAIYAMRYDPMQHEGGVDL